MHMNVDATRHPKLLKTVQNHRVLLDMVPSRAYEKAYGLFSSYLPCQFNVRMILDHIDEIERVYNLFYDEECRRSYLNILLYRLTLNEDYVNRAYSGIPQYWIPPFQNLNSSEVYVDCGAYIGDTFNEYCRFNANPCRAYLYEADPENAKTLSLLAQKYKDTQFHFINKGVYKKSCNLFFVAGKKISSYLSEDYISGSMKMETVSIDDSIDEDVSFIKMDIEGSEKNAILGAKRHIESTYPKLAICVYHAVSDLWDIPLMIHEMFPSYRHWRLYHHSTTYAETVLYVY